MSSASPVLFANLNNHAQNNKNKNMNLLNMKTLSSNSGLNNNNNATNNKSPIINASNQTVNDSGISSAQSLSSFTFTSPTNSSSIPSPTISLLSSSSSSPSSSSSSPISNLLIPSSNATSANLNQSLNKLANLNSSQLSKDNEITSAKKSAALSNISATIAKHQLLQQLNGAKSPTNSNINNKLLSLSLDNNNNNNGVACSLVKSNTNIYYNLKVDTNASKAIHYCNHCTNSDCKAIHKSLTKPLIAHSQPVAQPSVTTSLTSNSSNNNNPRLSAAQPLARIFLSPQLQPHQQIQLQPAPLSPTQLANSSFTNANQSSQQNQPQNQNNQFNKLLGANINFIFERRYPLVQLNSNLLNTATGQLQSPTSNTNVSTSFSNNNNSEPLQLSPSSSPSATQLLNSALNQLAQPNRHILISRGSNNGALAHNHNNHHHHSFKQNENEMASSPTTLSFPLPLSPSPHNHHQQSSFILQSNTNPASPTSKSATFSINFNRLPMNNASSTSNRRHLLQHVNELNDSNSNNNVLNHDQYELNIDETQPSPTSMFPINLNNLNLSYKNILFLDQVNKFILRNTKKITKQADLN